MRDDDFFEWYNRKATDDEKKLLEKLDDLSENFGDMLFRPGTSTSSLAKNRVMDDDGAVRDIYESIPHELEHFDYEIEVDVSQLDGCAGYYDSKRKILCISPENLSNNKVILHEMIHLHEDLLDSPGVPKFFHDCLFWALYSYLRKKMDGLDEIITQNAHVLNEQSLYEIGGDHDLTFFLKSLDLDIRMGYPLGTVFGYGMTERLAGVKLK